MKKTTILMAVLFTIAIATVSASSFFSSDSRIVPGIVNMEPNDIEYVSYCVDKVFENDVRVPYEGLKIYITTYCKDISQTIGCQAVDEEYPADFSVTAIDEYTNSTGCGLIKLETTDAFGGNFYFTINGVESGEVVTGETGVAFIPEMSVVGAGLVLVASGLYIARKRK